MTGGISDVSERSIAQESETAIAILTESQRVLVVAHRHADLDALGSAKGLTRALPSETAVYLPDGVASAAKPLCSGDEVREAPDTTAYDAVVVVDAPSWERIDPFSQPSHDVSTVLIDHHTTGTIYADADAAVVDTDAGATAELVYAVMTSAEWTIDAETAVRLLAGVLDDTEFLQDARTETIERAVELFKRIGGMESTLASLFEGESPAGERMARVKGVNRANIFAADSWSIATTRIGAHEGAVARALLDVGVDCAFVCSERDGRTRLVARCTDAFAEAESLGETILPELANGLGGDGGGHDTAGVATLPVTIERAETALRETVSERVETELRPIE
jgi:nanoRNase/pAp phosphatase (c-di-AMP/oligoRNAs hydrolase)